MDWSLRIAFCALVFATFAIWRAEELARFFHLSDHKADKSWKKKISAERHLVIHKQDNKSELLHAGDRDLKFLADFWHFADYLNEIYTGSPWSFQNSGRVEVGMGSENGASRTIEIRYNQQQTGTIEPSCFGYGNLPVRVEIKLINARHFDFYEVQGLAITVSDVICSPQEKPMVLWQVQAAILACIWEVGPQAIGNPEFDFTVRGNADEWERIKGSFPR